MASRTAAQPVQDLRGGFTGDVTLGHPAEPERTENVHVGQKAFIVPVGLFDEMAVGGQHYGFAWGQLVHKWAKFVEEINELLAAAVVFAQVARDFV